MHNHEKLQGPMPSSARCFTTMCVMQRVDLEAATRKTVLTYFWNGMA